MDAEGTPQPPPAEILNQPEQIPSDTEHFERYQDIVPSKGWGEMAPTGAHSEFINDYKQALTNNNTTVRQFVTDVINSSTDYRNIYFVSAQNADELSSAARRIYDSNKQTKHQAINEDLERLEDEVRGSGLPSIYESIYLGKIDVERQYMLYASAIGTPEFSPNTLSPESWADLIDIEATNDTGEITLKFEKKAEEALEKTKGANVKSHASIPEAIDTWNLSETEKEELARAGEITQNQTHLSPEQGVAMFEILGKRLGIEFSVELSDAHSALTYNPSEQVLYFPHERKLAAADVPYLFAHELMHATRAHNGRQQNLKILGVGVPGYEITEEGVAAMAEMALGQPFGHERQKLFAARYLMIAKALKTKMDDDGKTIPMYTEEDLYEELVNEYDFNEEAAATLIWRIMRGTSLKRQVVQLEVPGLTEPYQISEVYPKDAIYFQGQMEAFQWILKNLGEEYEAREDLTTDIADNEKLTRIFDALSYLARGKMRLDNLEELEPYLKDNSQDPNIVDFRRITKPRQEAPPQAA